MTAGVKEIVFATAACLFWLTGCETSSFKLPDALAPARTDADAPAAAAADMPSDSEPTGSVPVIVPPGDAALALPNPTPSTPNDDLSLAKEQFRQGNYGMAERLFRHAVEGGPNDGEAWLGLAASYDRLRRFDLADRAYAQLLKIVGPSPIVLNNLGYSYMLRGDFARARETLLRAQAGDPSNPFIRNNLALLDESARKRRAVR